MPYRAFLPTRGMYRKGIFMNDLKFNAVLSASFAAALTVACYPLTAPVISCVFDSLPVDWLSCSTPSA